MNGHEGCCHEGQGRSMDENDHHHRAGEGCCGEERHEHGYGFSRRFRDELFPTRERLQKTLEWLKEEKTELGKHITDIEVLLKGGQG
jgi:hypothetical protein